MSFKKLKLKLVTFDATNTLLKFRVPPWDHYATVGQEHGFIGTGDDLKPHLLRNFNSMLKKYPNFGRDTITWQEWWKQVVKLTFEGQLPPRANVDNIATQLIEEFKTSKCWCQAQGSQKLLKQLRDSNIFIGVISNFDPRLYEILADVRIDKDFHFIMTSYDVGYSKPDSRIFRLAIQKCGFNILPSEALHIGDDPLKDYDAARCAGWNAVLVATKIQTVKPLDPNHIFKTLEHLSMAIENDKLNLF